MANYTIKTKDGQSYKVEASDDATEEEVAAAFNQRMSAPVSAPKGDPEFPEGGNPLLPDAVERGFTRTGLAFDYTAYNLGMKSDEDFAKDISNFSKKMNSIPMSKRTRNQLDDIYSSKNPAQFVWNLATNPIGVGNLIVENLASVAAAGAVAGGGGLAARKFLTTVPAWARTGAAASVFGLSSGSLEASQSFFSDLAELNIDVSDPELIQEVVLEDEELLGNLRRRSLKRGIPVAAFDAVTFGIAGLPTKSFTKNFTDLSSEAFGRAAVAELGTQGLGGALGAASSQLWTEGKITDPIDIGLEFVLELITGGPQAAGSLLTVHGVDNPLMADIRDNFSSALGEAYKMTSELGGKEGGVRDRISKLGDKLHKRHLEKTEVPEAGEDLVAAVGLTEVPLEDKGTGTLFTESETEAVNFDPKVLGRLNKGAKKHYKTLVSSGQVSPLAFRGLVDASTPEGQTKFRKKDLQDFLKNQTLKPKTEAKAIHSELQEVNRQITNLKKKGKKNLKEKQVEKLDKLGLQKDELTAYKESFLKENNLIEKEKGKFLKDKSKKQERKEATPQKLAKSTPPQEKQAKLTPAEKVKTGEDTPEGAVTAQKIADELQPKIDALDEEIKQLQATSENLWDQSEEAASIEDALSLETEARDIDAEISEKQKELKKITAVGADRQKAGIFMSTPADRFTESFGPLLKAVALKPTAKKKVRDTMTKVRPILETMIGPEVKLTFVDELVDLSNITPEQFINKDKVPLLRGALWQNQVIISINTDINSDIHETVFHEALHAVLKSGLWDNPRTRNIIKRDIHKYMDMIRKSGNLDSPASPDDINPVEFESYLGTDEGIQELFATAGGLAMAQWTRDGKITKSFNLPKESSSLLRRLFEGIKKIWKAIRGENLTLEDIFIDKFPALQAARALTDSVLIEPHQKAAETKKNDISAKHFDFTSTMEEDLNAAAKEGRDTLPVWSRVFYSKAGLSEKHPVLKWLYGITRAKEASGHRRAEIYSGLSKPFWAIKKKKDRYAISEFARVMKEKGKKAEIDPETGIVTLEPVIGSDKKYKLNQEMSAGYRALQDASSAVINDFVIYYKGKAREIFDLPENFTAKDIEILKQDSKIKRSEKAQEQLAEIEKALSQFKKMEKVDYAPELRMGEFGNVVLKKIEAESDAKNPETIRKIGDQLYERIHFSTVERYGRKESNRYHPKQMERDQKIFKEKGYDGSQYVINPVIENIDGEATITSSSTVDNLTPFHLTQNDALNAIDPKLISIEAMIGLMGSNNLDKNGEAIFDIDEVMSKIELDSANRSFKNRFTQGTSMPGYSQDWDRVWRTYFHGAARSGAYFQYKGATEKLILNAEKNYKAKDPWLKDEIENYLKYVNNPATDFQKTRMASFFWTMGLAPVTALLQYMNLGTTSLAVLQQFSPNTLNNVKKISSHLALSRHFINKGNIEFVEGTPIVRWDNEEIWAKKIRPNMTHMNDAQFAEFKEGFLDAFKTGVLGAALVEEAATPTIKGETTAKETALSRIEKVIQGTGVFIAIAEQQSRAITHGAILDTLITDPNAGGRAARVLQGKGLSVEEMAQQRIKPNQKFDALDKIRGDLTFNQKVAQHGLDESHAVFGKTARPEFFKGIGGAVPFVFMTWPQQVWGTMQRMAFDRGAEGKLSLAVMLGAFTTLGGLSGFPGGELLKELYEYIYSTLNDEEIDIINNIHGGIGNRLVAETATHGLIRSLLGLDMAQRTNLSIPGEKILLYLLGALDDPAVGLGVAGSVIEGVRSAGNNIRNDSGFWRAAPDLLPVALANMVKAVGYTKEGAVTRKGTQLATPEEITFFDVATRFFGAQSASMSRKREEQWFSQVESTEDKAGYTRHKARMVNHLTRQIRAQRAGDKKRAAKHQKRYQKATEDLMKFIKEEKYMIAPADIMNSVMDTVFQRLSGDPRLKGVPKAALPDVLSVKQRYQRWD